MSGINMKNKLVIVSIYIFRIVSECIYFFLKLFPVQKNKIVFCSRQSNDVPLDFILLERQIKMQSPSSTITKICCHIGRDWKSYLRFIKAFFCSMYHISTSEVCVVDSYWPAVSILHHKRNLTIIQIWHALGKIKKSGYQTLGKTSGRKESYARALCMHKNYDYVIGGACVWNTYYCESFGIKEEKILNYGLPRIDYLIETEKENREKFYQEYPDFKNKKVILYAPTFRRNMQSHWERIVSADINEECILIIKNHPGQFAKHGRLPERIYYMENWRTIDLLAVCDCLITDYSAIALEAAVLHKKIYYWLYDYEQYVENNGVNIDLLQVAGSWAFKNLDDLMDCIVRDTYDMDFIENFRKTYLPEHMGNSTFQIVDLIISRLKEKEHTYEQETCCDYGGWKWDSME